jgi:hypothetical protein
MEMEKASGLKGGKVANFEPILNRTAKAWFSDTGKLNFPRVRGTTDLMTANQKAKKSVISRVPSSGLTPATMAKRPSDAC